MYFFENAKNFKLFYYQKSRIIGKLKSKFSFSFPIIEDPLYHIWVSLVMLFICTLPFVAILSFQKCDPVLHWKSIKGKIPTHLSFDIYWTSSLISSLSKQLRAYAGMIFCRILKTNALFCSLYYYICIILIFKNRIIKQ